VNWRVLCFAPRQKRPADEDDIFFLTKRWQRCNLDKAKG
jgi:hypothetical protein